LTEKGRVNDRSQWKGEDSVERLKGKKRRQVLEKVPGDRTNKPETVAPKPYFNARYQNLNGFGQRS